MQKNILLCDDEVHIVRAAEFKFRKAGYNVRCASNGEEAWTAILEAKPDILITDCQMPYLDGPGLCARIRENPETRDLPVLMLTAKGFELQHTDTAKQLGILAVIAKPFSPRELLQQVEQALGLAASFQASTPV